MVRLALPSKGRLAEPARTLLEDAGLDARTPTDRSLRANCGDGYQAVFARAQDIPELVADGAADAGITGGIWYRNPPAHSPTGSTSSSGAADLCWLFRRTVPCARWASWVSARASRRLFRA